MARKGYRRTNYRYRTRTIVRRARGGGGGFKPVIDGLIAGAGAKIIRSFVNVPFADDIAVLGVGYFRRNDTLKTIGGMGLAGDLLSGFGMGGDSGGYIV
ncbi:MAG: hypothetical protein BV456_08830 [Thermoplasmata archaeon M8B2D]|nr:MAG: hypothetical protein BV456_08830 [Thermoplasmata archaeon M8B2D]